jgi:hypothetical protein
MCIGHFQQSRWTIVSTACLLIANICETETVVHDGNQIGYEAHKCGPHYFLIGEDGLMLIHRVLSSAATQQLRPTYS